MRFYERGRDSGAEGRLPDSPNPGPRQFSPCPCTGGTVGGTSPPGMGLCPEALGLGGL